MEKKRIKKRYSVPLQTVRGQGSAVRTCGVVKDGHTVVFAVARIPICRTDGRRERFPCPSSTSLINRARIRFSIQRAVQETLLRETHRPRLPSQHTAHTHPPQVVDRGNRTIIICKSTYSCAIHEHILAKAGNVRNFTGYATRIEVVFFVFLIIVL